MQSETWPLFDLFTLLDSCGTFSAMGSAWGPLQVPLLVPGTGELPSSLY